MDPISAVALASGVARMFGLDQTLGRMIGGDKGAEVARKVTDVAGAITGGQSHTEIMQILNDPQRADKRNELYLRLIDIEAAESARIFADRADARDMQKIALQQEDLFSKRFVYFFAAAWSAFTMGYIVLITLAQIPDGSQRYADTILGFMLGTLIATIINYFFGSSKSSREKDSSLTALVESIKGKGNGS